MPLIYVSSVAALYCKVEHWKVAIKTICTARLNYLLPEPLKKDLLTTDWDSQGPQTTSNYNKTVGRAQPTTKRKFKTVASPREANGSNSTLSTRPAHPAGHPLRHLKDEPPKRPTLKSNMARGSRPQSPAANWETAPKRLTPGPSTEAALWKAPKLYMKEASLLTLRRWSEGQRLLRWTPGTDWRA